ncbi:MAG: hypothetical protein ACE5KM_10140 [Planctomycetaceae bacterium]
MTVPDPLLLADREQRIADWGDTVQPVIYAAGTLYKFPLPVRVFRFRDTWDFDRFKVPLKDGETIVGQSRTGVAVFVEGQIATQAGATKQTAAEMFAEVETMRSRLNANGTNGKFELFLFHDSATPYYRKFKACSTLRFEVNLSNENLFSYTAEIVSDDPVIHSTAEGL